MSSLNQQPVPPTPVLDPSHDALEGLLSVLLARPESEAEQRASVLTTLREISAQMEVASSIWRSYAENPIQHDDQFTAVMWVGPERSRDLHRVRLALRDLARKLSEHSGVAFHDTIGFSLQLDIVDAYGQLLPDETGASRAKDAIETIDKRRTDIEDAIARLS